MESYGIAIESKRIIVSKITKVTAEDFPKGIDRTVTRNRLSYCEEDLLRDYICHACKDCPCLQHSLVGRNRRDVGEIQVYRVEICN
ncbi:hypothetical protein KM043_001393 [Ampulex compressa]|nr:hypothetical protein KM043_001393 [Ampulex compressa]